MLHSEQLLPNFLKRWTLSFIKLISKSTQVCGLSLDQQQSSKLVMPKQREQQRTLNASQTNNSMRDSMRASAVHAIIGLLLPVLSFFIDHRAHQYV